jgi:uncharacterized protein with PQ loop repeat
MNGEAYMTGVAFLALFSWIPQIWRIIQTESSDDFSLWTTGILCWANGSFLWWAFKIEDTPLLIQQALTCTMLIVFTMLVLRYRSGSNE